MPLVLNDTKKNNHRGQDITDTNDQTIEKNDTKIKLPSISDTYLFQQTQKQDVSQKKTHTHKLRVGA